MHSKLGQSDCRDRGWPKCSESEGRAAAPERDVGLDMLDMRAIEPCASEENSQEWPELMPTLFRIICDANKDRSLTSIALFWCENDVVAFEVMKVMIKFLFGFET